MPALKHPFSRQYFPRHDSKSNSVHLQTNFARTSRKPKPALYEQRKPTRTTSTMTEKYVPTATRVYLLQSILDYRRLGAFSSHHILHWIQFQEMIKRHLHATAATRHLTIPTPFSTTSSKSRLAATEAVCGCPLKSQHLAGS